MNKICTLVVSISGRVKNMWADERQRVNLMVGLGMAGLLLLAGSTWFPAEEASPKNETAGTVEIQQDYAGQLEQRLEDILTQIDGVGATRVMVTLETGEENVYATDQETGGDGSSAVNHVLLAGEGLLETVHTPRVLGVAVVCEGGADATIQNRVNTLVTALTGVGANHITVTKMASTQ